MRILVCMKQVPDMAEAALRGDFSPDRETGAQGFNPADESALEWALQAKSALGGSVTALSMGPKRAESTLREALARGADRAVLLSDPRFAGADSLVTARCLAAAVGKLGADLIVCGRRAADGETGQVGPMLAALLDIPCVPNCTAAEPGPDGVLARQLTETGTRVWRTGYPALLTFCEWSLRLRLPSLSGLRQARRAEVPVWGPADAGLDPDACGLAASPTRVVRTEAQSAGARACRRLDAEALADAVGEVLA